MSFPERMHLKYSSQKMFCEYKLTVLEMFLMWNWRDSALWIVTVSLTKIICLDFFCPALTGSQNNTRLWTQMGNRWRDIE